MPTTRRGRYLYYRERAIRRNKLARGRGGWVSEPGGSDGNRTTGRGIDFSEWTKQVPKTYPKEPTAFNGGLLHDLFWKVKPTKGRFGVPHYSPIYPPWWGPNTHDTYNGGFYFHRRIRSIPPQSWWTYKPYLLPKSALKKGDVYPFEKYPSGAPSFASGMGWV